MKISNYFDVDQNEILVILDLQRFKLKTFMEQELNFEISVFYCFETLWCHKKAIGPEPLKFCHFAKGPF